MERLCSQCRELGFCQLQSSVDGLKNSGYSGADASRIVNGNQNFKNCPKFEELLGQLGVADSPTSAAEAKQPKSFANNGAGVQYQTGVSVSSRSLNEGTVFGYGDDERDEFFVPDYLPENPDEYFNHYVPKFLRGIVFDMWRDGKTDPPPELLENYGVYAPADINSIPQYVKYAIQNFPNTNGVNDC